VMNFVKILTEWAKPPAVVVRATADRGKEEFRDKLKTIVEGMNMPDPGTTNSSEGRIYGTVQESRAVCRLQRENILDDRIIQVTIEWQEVAETKLEVYVRIRDKRNNRAFALILIPIGVYAVIHTLVVSTDLGAFVVVLGMTAGLILMSRRSYLQPPSEVVDSVQDELSERMPYLRNWVRE